MGRRADERYRHDNKMHRGAIEKQPAHEKMQSNGLKHVGGARGSGDERRGEKKIRTAAVAARV